MGGGAKYDRLFSSWNSRSWALIKCLHFLLGIIIDTHTLSTNKFLVVKDKVVLQTFNNLQNTKGQAKRFKLNNKNCSKVTPPRDINYPYD